MKHTLIISAAKAESYIVKSGEQIHSFLQRRNEERDSVASGLLALAKTFKIKGKFLLDKFLTACGYEEVWITSSEAGQNRVQVVPKVWSDAKSIIKRAAENGINVLDFDTVSAIKKALNSKNRPALKTIPISPSLDKGLARDLSELAKLLPKVEVGVQEDVEKQLDGILEQVRVAIKPSGLRVVA
jgi:hypothetical protein